MATTRTRQRSMKEFFAPAAFDQSPMKAARRAGRTHTGSSTNAASQATTSTQVQDETDDVGEEESEDPILLSPRSKANGKGKTKRRSPDESEDGERKRPKLELDGDDKEAAKAIFGGTRIQIKPSSTFPPAQTAEHRPLGLRATSVPPDTSPPRVDLSKLVLGSPRRRRSPVRGALRYTSEPADVKDLDLDGVDLVGKGLEKEKEKEKLDTVAEAPATPTPGPRASMDALYKARKRMGSASPATPPQRPADHAPPLDVVAEEPPVAHPPLPEPATSSPPIPPATPDTGHGHAPPSYFNFESSPAREHPPSSADNTAHTTNNSQITTPRDGPSRKRPRSPVAKSSPADRLASSVRASKLLDSLFSFDDAPTAIPSPKLTQSRTGGGSPALARSTGGDGAPVLSRSTSGDSERRDEPPLPVQSPAKDKSRAKRGKKDRPDKRAPSLVPSSRSSRPAKGKSATPNTSVDVPAVVQEAPQPKKPTSRSSAKSAHSRAPQLEPLVVDTQRAQPEAGPSSESPLTALPSENERIPSVPAEETTAPVPPENVSPSAHEEDVPLPAPVEEAMPPVQAEGEGDTTMVGGDDTFVVEAPAEVEVPAEVEQPVIAHEDIAPADGGVPATPMDEDPPSALDANTTLDAALDRARTQSPPADPSHPHEDAPLVSDPSTSSSIPHEIEQLRDDAPSISNTPALPPPPPPPPAPVPVPEDTDLPMSDLTQPSSDAELTGLDDMSELTAQSEPEAEDAPVVVHEEVHARRGRGRGRGAAAAGRGRGRGAAPSQVFRGGAPATRGSVRGSGPATATGTRGRRGGIPRAAPSTSRLTRSSSTRTVDSTGTTVSRETTGKGKEKEKEKDVEGTKEKDVEAAKDKDKGGDDMDVEIVKDVGDAMDVDDGPSSSVRQRPKTPLKMTVELPAEGSKTPGRAKTPGPGPFVRPKTPGVSNAKSTGSDASSSNAAAPRRTGGFAAPTASSLSKTQASPSKRPAPSASSPTKPASRPFLTSKASHSSLSNLNAVLERARASTSMGFSRDAPRPARTREDLPDRLDGSSLHANANANTKGKGKAGAKEKPKLTPGQTTLNGAGPSKPTGAGPSTLNGPSPAAAPLKRTASLGALGRGAPPGAGGGGMKQATLPFARPPRAAGFPARRMLASQKSRLAPIKGSPVKGGAAPTFEIEMSDDDEDEPRRDKGKGRAVIAPMDFSKLGESAVADSDSDQDDDAAGFSTLIGPATPASRVHAGWEKNASRRASLASENLLALQAQAQSPGTPPESERARSTRSGGAAPPNPAAGVPRVLRLCSVYVDVRGPEGDDQGTWFVETLKLLGARVQTRLGSACTHIVFRGGGAGTLLRYTQLPEPKPAVVGVGWVVACAEEVRALEPGAFLVDVAAASAEALVREKSKPQPRPKKRKSTVPNFSVSPIAPGRTPAFVQENEDGDGLPQPGGSGRAQEEEDITPLERARRRREAMEAGKAGK